MIRPSLVLLLALSACGDDGASQRSDATVADMPQSDTVLSGCDYIEQRDATNDDVPPAMGTPEATNLTFSTRTVVCGTFDHTHFDGDITVDIDGYTFTVGSDADVLVRIYGEGAEAIEFVGVDVYAGPNLDQLMGAVTFYGDHGVSTFRLPAGTYELVPFALHAEAITAPVPYRIEVVADAPAIRCAEETTGGYVEANDGAGNNGNDVYVLNTGQPPSLTASADDEPEQTGLVVSPSTNRRFTGTAADIASPDMYEDKDTFQIATNASTNELTVLLSWPGTGTNLDFLLFEESSTTAVMRGNLTASQGLEAKTHSVKPSTNYWLVVGARAGGTVPRTYSTTLCGTTFTP